MSVLKLCSLFFSIFFFFLILQICQASTKLENDTSVSSFIEDVAKELMVAAVRKPSNIDKTNGEKITVLKAGNVTTQLKYASQQMKLQSDPNRKYPKHAVDFSASI
ncbi:hypothetical protein WDU94_010506 [Cyamophila willieti]